MKNIKLHQLKWMNAGQHFQKAASAGSNLKIDDSVLPHDQKLVWWQSLEETRLVRFLRQAKADEIPETKAELENCQAECSWHLCVQMCAAGKHELPSIIPQRWH